MARRSLLRMRAVAASTAAAHAPLDGPGSGYTVGGSGSGMVELQWRWSTANVSMLDTVAGFVAAVMDPFDAGFGSVTVYGVIRGRSTISAISSGKLDLRCAVGNDSVVASRFSSLFEGFSVPHVYEDRFHRPHPEVALLRHTPIGPGVATFSSVRFTCAGLAADPRPLEGRMLRVSIGQTAIDGIRIHAAPYPILSGDHGKSTDTGLQRHRQGHNPAIPVPSVDTPASSSDEPAPTVTVCVQYVHGRGYSPYHVADFAAYYYLLGAARIVVFESQEPHLEADADARAEVVRNQRGLRNLADALGPRFTLAHGLCTHEVMRRTTLNQNCQVLAGNLCLSAARGADAQPYALMVDFDEYAPLRHANPCPQARGHCS